MNRKILVVDDERAILGALEGLLSDEQTSVLTATSGQAALELLVRGPVDLVISDRMMPGMDGLSLLKRVHELHPDTPLMMLTGMDQLEVPDDVRRDLGDLAIMSKPWDTKELRRGVGAAIESRKERDETDAIRRLGKVTEDQLERARRVAARLSRPKPLAEVLFDLGELSRDDLQRIAHERLACLSLVDLLQAKGHLSDEDVAAFFKTRASEPNFSDRLILVTGKLVTEAAFLEALAIKRSLRFAEPQIATVDTELVGRASMRYLRRNNVLPSAIVDGRVQVFLSDPDADHLIAELSRIFSAPVTPVLCPSEKITEALNTIERLRGSSTDEPGAPTLQYREIGEVGNADENGEEAVQIVDYLLARALQLVASDLHIEPMQDKLRVRVRVDGVLIPLTDLPIEFAPRICSRLKILASCDISEKRLHQDGKIYVRIDGRDIDIRVSSYVSVHGETMVLRLLDRSRGIVPIDKIGFTPRAFASLTEIVLEASSGLVLIVGPTGSGKTTTLYSFISHANDPTEKVITAEDPVEYVMPGVVQCSVNQKTGPTFADSLRAIVRQDPDTIVIGEVRDEVTVSLALESALTGHKVYSTFHTEDSVGAFVRLLEMGAEPFLVASTVTAVVAQRLVRRLCTQCRKPGDPNRAEQRFLGLEREDYRGQAFQVAVGCGQCNGTGYRGRVAIHEVLLPDDEFRDLVMHRAAAKELRVSARRLSEFLTLQEDGLLKAAEGLTSIAEIITNAPRDTAARPLKSIRSALRVGRKQ